MIRRARGLLPLLVAGCVAGGAGSLTPSPSRGFRPEDRVVIGDFSRVNAIAAANDRVYVVYPGAIATWRPIEQRWEVPRSPPRPGQLHAVTVAITDPLDRSLWLAAGSAWIHFDPFANRWDDGDLPAPADLIALDAAVPGSGTFFRTASGWVVVSRAGGVAMPSEPPRSPRYPTTVDDAMRDLPQLRALAPHVATGPMMIEGTLTAAAPDPRGSGWFLGTSTRGLVFFDRMGADGVPVPLGLPGDAVGALALAPGGVWVATDRDPRHLPGLTRLAGDLGAAMVVGASPVRGWPFNVVRRLLVTARGTWLATDLGTVHVTGDSDDMVRYDVANGLPDDRVTSLAEYRGQVVAGTLGGLAISRGDTGFRHLVVGSTDPVLALLAAGDTLWVGTDRGLFALVPGAGDLRMPDGFRRLTGATTGVAGIGYVDDTLVAMTRERLLWRDPVTGEWHEGPDLTAQLGLLSVCTPTANGIWVGGTGGAALVRPGIVAQQVLSVPNQLPDAVTAIAIDAQYLWIGTRSGLVRYLLVE